MKSTRIKLPPKTDWLLAYLLLDRLNGAQACEWAVAALEAGFDTEALTMLASMSFDRDLNMYAVKPYLSKTLRELRIPEPVDRAAVLRAYAIGLAEQLSTGQVSARPILDEIHSAVVSPLNHPADLMGWCYLWEGNSADGTFAEISEAEIEREALTFATKWLAGAKHDVS